MTNTHEAPLPRWSVADVHESFESRTFTDSMERLGASITRLEALFEEHNVRAIEHRTPTAADGKAADATIQAFNSTVADSEILLSYVYATVSTDSRDERAQGLLSELENLDARVSPLLARLADWVASLGASDLTIYQQAHQQLMKKLKQAWANRAADLPYDNPYEALIMASIVEKETGRAAERARIASVFVNRLRRGMPLQTDPTVIYGMGDRFDGNIRKQDLQTDTPYNTYTRGGLPPTPIALAGKDAIDAALHPAAGKDLYFVARGDGSSQFSENLEDHNKAVNKYQR